jgi:UrcA family protein
MLKSILLPIAALGAAAALTTAASAQPVGGVTVRALPPADVQVQSKAVYYRDLDLNSRDGARTLFHRIREAASEVCDPRPAHLDNLRDYRDYQDFAHCQIDGINLAVAEANIPALTRYVDGLR